MKTKSFCALTAAFCCFGLLETAPGRDIISDPIPDFLSLPVEYRYGIGSEVVRVDKVACDLDNDGIEDQFLGHYKIWTGDMHSIYFAFYRGMQSGFQRLTAPERDFPLARGYFNREFSFCGFVAEQQTEGLLVCAYADTRDTKEVHPTLFPECIFFHIKDGHLQVDQLGPLDLSKAKDLAFYQRYFAEGVKSRPVTVSTMTKEQLIQAGYKVPDWSRQPPQSSSTAPANNDKNQVTNPPPMLSNGPDVKPSPALAAPQIKQEGQRDEPTSSTRWLVLLAAVAAALSLLWLDRKRRK